MSDYHRSFRPVTGTGVHAEVPRVVKNLQNELPENWKEKRQVDPDGWLELPDGYQADPAGGMFIVVKIKGPKGLRFRLLDKQGYDKLLEKVNSKDFLAEEMGLEDKTEFFCAVDAVDYDPAGRVRLTQNQLITLNVDRHVELHAVKGDLEIGPP